MQKHDHAKFEEQYEFNLGFNYFCQKKKKNLGFNYWKSMM
jgi:hypothetical protein